MSEYINKYHKIFSIVLFVMMAGPSATGSTPQINWLKAQQNLNATGLVDSYEGDSTNRAYTYDQAVATIAFTVASETSRARAILEKMEQLQDSSGRWYECYDAANLTIPGECLLYNTGPISWMVIAVNFYEGRTQDPNYAEVAEKALGWLDTMANSNPDDEQYGSIRYCSGPACSTPNVISTEHNHDAYSAYYWRGVLGSNDAYLQKANLILDYLAREAWGASSESNCEYNSEVFWRGFNDCEWCTDPQTWGVLSVGPIGPGGEVFHESLQWLWYSEWGNTRSQQDYNDEILGVDGFKSCTEQLTDHIWVEATEGAAAAYYNICDDERGDYFHSQSQRVISGNGGVIHTFTETDPNNIRWPENWRYNSVASTSWYYFNERRVNPFDLGDADKFFAANIDRADSVTFSDFSILESEWLLEGLGLASDTNGDCLIDLGDLVIIAGYWLESRD